MIRTIADETRAAAHVAASLTPLPDPSGQAAPLPSLTAASGSGTGLGVTSGVGAVTSLFTEGEVTPGSVWPLHGIDTFTEFGNDVGAIARPQDFNALVSALRAIEGWTLRVLRASPGDLADRLDLEGRRIL